MIQKFNFRILKNSVILPIENSPGKYVFFCPGCDNHHIINVSPKNRLPCHKLKGTSTKPTITPSVLSRGDEKLDKPNCHSYVTKGRIHFLKDSGHSLAGKTVDLKPMR